MSERNTFAHLLHDAGLAAWFGGSLMGAVGVNGASNDLDEGQRARAASDAWARWTPVNAAAIGAHLLGGALLLKDNRTRVSRQKGVKANTLAKLALTGGAVAATAYSRVLGQKVMEAGDVPAAGGVTPNGSTPPEVASAQKQLKALQWAIPGLTGAVLASSSLHEEQQRPSQVLKGSLQGALRDGKGKAGVLAGLAGDLAGDMAGKAGTRAGEVASKAGTRASEVASEARDTMSAKVAELRS